MGASTTGITQSNPTGNSLFTPKDKYSKYGEPCVDDEAGDNYSDKFTPENADVSGGSSVVNSGKNKVRRAQKQMQKEQAKISKCQLSDVAASVDLGTSVKATSAIISPANQPSSTVQPRQTRQRTASQKQLTNAPTPDEDSISRKTAPKRSLRASTAAAKSIE